MNSTEDAVREWMLSATPVPAGRVDVGAVMERARRRRRVRSIAIPSLAAVAVAAAITVVIVAAGPDRTGSGIAAPPSTSRIADAASCSKTPTEPDLGDLREGTAQQMVPSGAVSADVCRFTYKTVNNGPMTEQVLGSAHLDPGEAATLARQLNQTGIPVLIGTPSSRSRPGPVNCLVGVDQDAAITFTYSTGPSVTVAFSLIGCSTMTNGVLAQRTGDELITWIYAHTPDQGATAGPTISP